MSGSRGHRVLAHTADVILEAWGPDLATSCEEAVAALVEVYLEGDPVPGLVSRTLHVPPGPSDHMLLGLLQEVIFTLDTSDDPPMGADISAAPDGGLDVTLHLSLRSSVTPAGAVPKAVSRSGLQVAREPDGVRCTFLVDV